MSCIDSHLLAPGEGDGPGEGAGMSTRGSRGIPDSGTGEAHVAGTTQGGDRARPAVTPEGSRSRPEGAGSISPLPTVGPAEGSEGKGTGRLPVAGCGGRVGTALPEVPISPRERGQALPALCPSTKEVTAGPFSFSCLPGAMSGSVLSAWSWSTPSSRSTYSCHSRLRPSPAQPCSVPIPRRAAERFKINRASSPGLTERGSRGKGCRRESLAGAAKGPNDITQLWLTLRSHVCPACWVRPLPT